MLADILGFTVTRTIPDKALFGVLTGLYKVCGGVVRKKAGGQIVAHLINAGDPLDSSVAGRADVEALNSYSLNQIGRFASQIENGFSELQSSVGTVNEKLAEVTQTVGTLGDNVIDLQAATSAIISLSTGTMILSGLTLAAGTAGFVFLNKKLNRIDRKLQELQKDVKEIKAFLNTHQRAELTTALNTLRDVADAPSDETRRQLLVHSRQTLGTLHHHYRSQFIEAGTDGVISASEEYFTITAIAHALCAGELDMYETAARDLEDSYKCWSELCRKVAKEKLLGADPQRFFGRRYATSVRADELIDWMEFAHDDEKGIGWIDELRTMPSRDSWRNKALTREEVLEIELFRRLASRNRIYQGYCSQYQFFKQNKIRPMEYQRQIEQLDRSQLVGDTFLMVANEILHSDRAA